MQILMKLSLSQTLWPNWKKIFALYANAQDIITVHIHYDHFSFSKFKFPENFVQNFHLFFLVLFSLFFIFFHHLTLFNFFIQYLPLGPILAHNLMHQYDLSRFNLDV